jgi:RNA polymerase sigma-70 factor (ECF subfamily)
MGVPVTELMTHLPNLQRYARRLTHNDDTANDLVQETVVRALRHLDRYQPTGSLQGWLITIMKNQFRETQRRRLLDLTAGGRGVGVGVAPAVLGDRLDAPQDDQLLLRELGAAIPRLPAVQRDVLIAVCLQGLSYEQASAKLGIPIGTIRSRLFRARGALQELLEPFAAPGAFSLVAAAARAHARTRH